MASVIPMTMQAGLVRHSCGEMNPCEARFCGGCGTDLLEGKACGSCGYVGTPASRFCHGCGARLLQVTAGASDPDANERLAAVEAEFGALREDIQSLLELKDQLDAALKRVRQKQGGSGASGSRVTQSKSGAAKPAPASTAEGTPPDIGESADSGNAEAEPGETQPNATTIAIIHFEDRADLQETVRATVSPYTSAVYHTEAVLAQGMPEGRPLLVVNLLSGDPLAAVTAPEVQMKNPSCFTYATDGTRGFTLGVTAFFAPPFDAEACATRIVESLPTTPRVLLVSEAAVGTPELRAHLVRQGCTASVAFDDRQALGIIPSVRPNLVLIDLNLPRGDGLRLAARIRADQSNNHMRIAFLWQNTIEPDVFRKFVSRAVLDFAFKEDDLKRALMQEFNPGGSAYAPNR